MSSAGGSPGRSNGNRFRSRLQVILALVAVFASPASPASAVQIPDVIPGSALPGVSTQQGSPRGPASSVPVPETTVPPIPFVRSSANWMPLALPPRLPADGHATRSADPLTPQAVDHGDGYYLRLDIHRYGSYAMLPIFAATYLAGNELLNGTEPAGWVRSAHGLGVGALGVLFSTNTVTGVWNAIEARNDPGSFRRLLHSALMLAADAGFLYTASLASESEDDDSFNPDFQADNRRHRDWALGSMAVSTAGTLLMWLWKD